MPPKAGRSRRPGSPDSKPKRSQSTSGIPTKLIIGIGGGAFLVACIVGVVLFNGSEPAEKPDEKPNPVADTEDEPKADGPTEKFMAEMKSLTGAMVEPIADAATLSLVGESTVVVMVDVPQKFMRDDGSLDGEFVSAIDSSRPVFLRVTNLGDAGAKQLANVDGLRGINTYGPRLTGRGLAVLADHPGLRWLDLSAVQITNGDLAKLSTRLTFLSLSTSIRGRAAPGTVRVTNEGLKSLARLKSLRSLSLDRLSIDNVGIGHLAEFENLRSLSLANLDVDDDGIAKLSELELTSLTLNDMSLVTDVSVDDLVRMPKLERLWLFGTGVTDMGVQRIRSAHPDLELLHR